MKIAIIETGGKQYRVAEGDVIFVEKLEAEEGASVKFDKVLAVIDGERSLCLRRIRRRQGRQAGQEQEDPRLQDEAQEGLPQDTGPSSALHQG